MSHSLRFRREREPLSATDAHWPLPTIRKRYAEAGESAMAVQRHYLGASTPSGAPAGSLGGLLGGFLGRLRRYQLDASQVNAFLQEHVGEGQLGSRNLLIRCNSREPTIVRGTIRKICEILHRRVWHASPPSFIRREREPLSATDAHWPLPVIM
jgi:hypothetical protein